MTMERSSLPIKTKITVLSREIVRWKKNTWRGEERRKGDERMSKFMVKLKASGYSREQRWEILKSGSRKYKRMVAQEDGGVRKINRPRWEGGQKRYTKKLLGKKNWYRKKRVRKEDEVRRVGGKSMEGRDVVTG